MTCIAGPDVGSVLTDGLAIGPPAPGGVDVIIGGPVVTVVTAYGNNGVGGAVWPVTGKPAVDQMPPGGVGAWKTVVGTLAALDTGVKAEPPAGPAV